MNQPIKNRDILQLLLVACTVASISCSSPSKEEKNSHNISDNSPNEAFDIAEAVKVCEMQLEKTIQKVTDLSKHPRLIETDQQEWKQVPNGRLVWTSGFYPGILWYMYDLSGKEKWKNEAIKRTEVFESFKTITAHHDIGFMMFPAYGNGYELGGKKEYKDILLTSAASLASRYNPEVGTIKSWSNEMHPRWKQHITIIDNMLNLELLFWAAKHGGDARFYEIAVNHAETTMKNHFREDYTSWHVLEYDSLTGEVLHRHTKQGYGDDSRWARGLAWGIYGYSMVYRETGDKQFLDFAIKITDKYLSLLPDDMVPYWDFDAPNLPQQERDASAAAIVASGLIELSTLVDDQNVQQKYMEAAVAMLQSLSSEKYSGNGKSDSFLLHSTGAKPLGHEIDVALIYADYYYIEALDRLSKLTTSR
ncbi:glucuronyl hydrolase [Echinicola strongylocentroti]|uniref:Glucuronyl hydrolase n=1 Tax=Echinicola strongylocentroti TaxID=1795355 RepID=A0A2Z4IE93_9BACT|nr:glycoside hydrolase family 88 protein [Echinicola strongylocentroti]AWW28798.1 glucuronyl hydrolase [Echinicola strongylocentroti]